MSGAMGTALLLGFVFASTSCKQIKNSLNDFAKGAETSLEALPDSESLAGADGLPVEHSFRTVTPATMANFVAAGDRISMVEFYSDT